MEKEKEKELPPFHHLCNNCIAAIQSRGEKIFVGSELDYEEWADEHDGEMPKCEWCEEGEDITLYEVIIP